MNTKQEDIQNKTNNENNQINKELEKIREIEIRTERLQTKLLENIIVSNLKKSILGKKGYKSLNYENLYDDYKQFLEDLKEENIDELRVELDKQVNILVEEIYKVTEEETKEETKKETNVDKWMDDLDDLIYSNYKKKSDKRDSENQKKNWKAIGSEVSVRKRLVIAAALDLKKKYPQIANPLMLASTDVFVEKAQVKITERADNNLLWGRITAFVSIALLVIAAYFIFANHISSGFDGFYNVYASEGKVNVIDKETKDYLARLYSNSYISTIIIAKTASIGAFILGAVYFLISLSRAFFHEATILYHRRHALRFGRLYVYLKDDDITLDELEKAFQWNAEFSTAFKDINADKATKTIWSKLLEAPVDTLKAMTRLFELNNKSTKKSDNKED
jgi:hypothetical protein